MSTAHVLIGRQEGIPTELIEEFTGTLRRLSISFEVEERKREVCNSLEHYVPTAIVVLLAKPFFDGFLKKAGEDTYAQFKRGLLALLKKASALRVEIVRSGQRKLSPEPEYSRVISVYAQSLKGRSVKFLLPDKVSDKEADIWVESLLQALGDYYSQAEGDQLSAVLASPKSQFAHVLRFDQRTKSWARLELVPRS